MVGEGLTLINYLISRCGARSVLPSAGDSVRVIHGVVALHGDGCPDALVTGCINCTWGFLDKHNFMVLQPLSDKLSSLFIQMKTKDCT